jgi:WS/DGAT/MGAT family acyltransferase
MDKLSSADAAFLYLETAETPMNIGSVTIFEPAGSKTDVFQSFRDHTAARLDLLPSYRRYPVMTPLNLDHPVWAIENDPDLDYHVRRCALPPPGSIEQLRSLIAELMVIPFDRARPLWRYYVIEGLEGGRFAVFMKVHHAAMDGISGIAAMPIIFDFSPDPAPLPEPPKRDPAGADAPGLPLVIRGAIDRFFDRQRRMIVAGPKIATAIANVTRRASTTLRHLPDLIRLAPKTLFNTSISGERSWGTASISLTEVKAVAKRRHVTVNDIILAVCAGALRRYLMARNALPKEPMIASIPVSLREPGQTELNVQVGAVLSSLATDIADPLERLAVISEAAQEAKGRLMDIKQALSGDVGDILGPPLLAPALAWLAGYTHIYDILPNAMNLWISNVPGPRQPFYCAGARAVYFFPVSIANHGCALNITNQSYMDNIDFGLTACRRTVPDVQKIADDLVAEFAALKLASEAARDPAAVEIIDIAAPVVPANPALREASIDVAEEPRVADLSPAPQADASLPPSEPASEAAASIAARRGTSGKPAQREKGRAGPTTPIKSKRR